MFVLFIYLLTDPCLDRDIKTEIYCNVDCIERRRKHEKQIPDQIIDLETWKRKEYCQIYGSGKYNKKINDLLNSVQ